MFEQVYPITVRDMFVLALTGMKAFVIEALCCNTKIMNTKFAAFYSMYILGGII